MAKYRVYCSTSTPGLGGYFYIHVKKYSMARDAAIKKASKEYPKYNWTSIYKPVKL